MDMKLILSVTAVLGSLALGSLSHSAEPAANDEDTKKGNRAVQFGKLDKNADGSLSKDEFMDRPSLKGDPASAEKAAKAFSKMDANGDGVLSKEEFVHAGQKGGGQATGE
jgi:Ca2+-binding EF-hand superfamily protein